MIENENPAEAEDQEDFEYNLSQDDRDFLEWTKANVSDDEPTEPEKAEPEQETEQEADPEPDEPDEPFPGYKGLPDEVRQHYDQATARAADWENRWKAQHGQLGPAQRQLSQYQRRTQELERELEALKKQQPAEDPVAKAKREQWEKDFPEEAEALKSHLTPLQKELEETKARLAQTYQAQQETQRQIYVKEQLAELSTAHPDWRDVRQSEQFGLWVNSLDADDAALLDRMDAQSNIKLLTRFKQDMWIAQQHYELSKAGETQAPQQPKKPARSDVAPTSRVRQSGVARPNANWTRAEAEYADWLAQQGIKA